MKRITLVFGSAFGLLGVALGAFGAHGLEDILIANDRTATWDTAVLYQLVHVGLLLFLSLVIGNQPATKLLRISAWAAIIGTVIFSGSLYLLSLTNLLWLGAITPFGGVSFLVAWTTLLIHSLQNKNHS